MMWNEKSALDEKYSIVRSDCPLLVFHHRWPYGATNEAEHVSLSEGDSVLMQGKRSDKNIRRKNDGGGSIDYYYEFQTG